MSVPAATITDGQFPSHGEAVVMPAARYGLADMSVGTRLFRMVALAVIATLGLTVLSAFEKRASGGGFAAVAGGRAETIGVGVSGSGAKADESRPAPPARMPAAAGQARGGSAIEKIPPSAARRTGTDDEWAQF